LVRLTGRIFNTLAVLLNNLQQIGFIYEGIWLPWRLLEVAIVPLDGGGVSLLN